ncbi:MAG TPA: hypothetical protein V6C78_30455 [Crinalium sp.]|jgi:hypothetical protein
MTNQSLLLETDFKFFTPIEGKNSAILIMQIGGIENPQGVWASPPARSSTPAPRPDTNGYSNDQPVEICLKTV